jgi:hypothetical protein
VKTLSLPSGGAGGSADILVSIDLSDEGAIAVASGFGLAVRAPAAINPDGGSVAAVVMTVNRIGLPDTATGTRLIDISFVTPNPKVDHDSNANATVPLLHGEVH